MNAPINVNLNLADQYGALAAQVAEARKALDAVRAQLVALGEPVVEGTLFRVTVSEAVVTATDWKAVVEAIQPDPDLVELYQAQETRITVKAVMRKVSA